MRSKPSRESLTPGRIYAVRARNLTVAVYAGGGRFVGIRTKFGSRFLDVEYLDEPAVRGTVNDAIDLGVEPLASPAPWPFPDVEHDRTLFAVLEEYEAAARAALEEGSKK